MVLLIKTLSLTLMLRLMRKEKNVVKVIKPNPPICIRTRMTSCPNNVKYEPVSTTMRPVTHVAEVAVNKASTMLMWLPTVASGSRRSPVPIKITKMKLATNNWAGASFESVFLPLRLRILITGLPTM